MIERVAAAAGRPVSRETFEKLDEYAALLRDESSRQNLIKLLPHLTELRMYDNSFEADPSTGAAPQPKLILHVKNGKIESAWDSTIIPAWTRPILAAALTL